MKTLRKDLAVAIDEIGKVSIVIPNYNGKELLVECLPGIIKAAYSYNTNSEIIVVDDASTDDSVSFLKKNFPDVKVVSHAVNKGFGKACNTGVATAINRLVVLLNSDISAEGDFITPMVKHFSDPAVFAVQPKMFYWDKDSFNAGMNMGRMERGYIRIWNEAETKNAKHVYTTAPNLYAIGGAMAFDKQKWDELGGFDELYYPFCWEDIDISYRALKRGWKVLYEPGSILFHKHHGTLSKIFKPSYRRVIEQKNEMVFIWKNIHDKELIKYHLKSLPRLILLRLLSGDYTFHRAFLRAFAQIRGILKARRLEQSLSSLKDSYVLNTSLRYYRNFIRRGFVEERGMKKQILLLNSVLPYPPADGGKMRVYTLLRYLSQEFDIHLMAFVSDEEEKKYVPELKKFCKEVDTVVRKWSPMPLSASLLMPKHFQAFYSEEMKKKLLEILKTRPIDLVQVEFSLMAYYINFIKHIPVVFTEHDAGIFLPNRSYMPPQKGWNRLGDYFDFLRTLRWMIEHYKKFDKIITVTDKDKETLLSFLPELDIEIITTGTDIDYFSCEFEEVNEKRLVFVGSMGHYPNVDAMLFFYREILTLIRRQIPDVTLTVIGSGPSERIRNLSSDPAIEVTGYVEDIRPYVKKGAVFIAPMRRGAGIKGKLLEAMAMRKPIVTTPVGCQGIPVFPGRDLLVASNPKEFAEKVILLLNTPDLRRDMALNAYEVVKREYDWGVISKRLINIYGQLMDGDKCCQ